MKTLLTNLIKAAFSAIWLKSWEPDEAQAEIIEMAETEGFKEVLVWDCVRGLQQNKKYIDNSSNPIFPLTKVSKENLDDVQIILLHNFHRFLESPIIVQAFINAALRGKSIKTFYIILSPIKNIPVELERLITIVDHDLPNEKDIRKVADSLDEIPPDEAVAAAKGLTRRQVEDSFSLSLVQEGEINPNVIWDLKKGFINERSYMSFSRGGPKFDSIGGLENLKSFARKLLRFDNPVTTKGLMLLGAPGTGKSAWAKALGSEVGRPTITLDFGALYHKHVGETERQIRDALDVTDAMGKSILFIDEVEKALAGSGGDGGDSGVAARAFGTFLTWLSDREDKGSDTFVVMTSNDISKLPPEFTRAERLDAVFMIDLPNKLERAMIWDLYLTKYSIKEKMLDIEDYTGAEIKSTCRLAKSMGCSLKEASGYVVPIATTSKDKIESLREYAKGRCISANYPGLYNGRDVVIGMEIEQTTKRNICKKV